MWLVFGTRPQPYESNCQHAAIKSVALPEATCRRSSGVHHAGPEMRPKVGPDAFDTHCAGHKRWCHMLVCFLVPL